MRYHLASNDQLTHIFKHEKDCPTHLLSGVILEMINRDMVKGFILHAAKSTNIYSLDEDDILQVGLIELHECIGKFKPGSSAPQTFAYKCLRNRFKMEIEKQGAKKRGSEFTRVDGEELDDYLIVSPFNVERYVINKMEIEQCLSYLTEREQTALIMYSDGYLLREIADLYGYKDKTSALQIINRARKKIRKELGYDNQIQHQQIS